MRHFAKHGLALAVAVMMTACASNKGGFGANKVEVPPVKTPDKPTLKDVPAEPRTPEQIDKAFEPALGFEAELLERNIHGLAEDAPKHLVIDDIQPISDSLETVTARHEAQIKQDKRRYKEYSANLSNSHNHASNFFPSRNREYMQFVKSGWTMDTFYFNTIDHEKKIRLAGLKGFVFYQGTHPSQALPTANAITYKGTWDFMTDAKKDRKDTDRQFRNENTRPNAGDWYSATSMHETLNDDPKLREARKKDKNVGEVSHTSEFTVNFEDKTLKGVLKHNKYDTSTKTTQSTDRYTLDAKLHGNRFRGSAKATKADDAYFGANSSTLEGGFFGDKAQELAGKFLADDKSLFAVFGARQHKDGVYVTDDTTADVATMFDATKINAETFVKSSLDTFGDATKLVVDGRSFSLLPKSSSAGFVNRQEYDLTDQGKLVISACCSNLNHLQFGHYYLQNNDKKSGHHLFLTGERTLLAQMPKTGEFEYAGTWEANILTTGQKVGGVSPNNATSGSRAKFGVNFGTKTITGSLYQDNGGSPAILIKDGVISGNGFSAKFQTPTSGLVLDTMTGDAAHLSGDVSGAFYGQNAQELGGYFYSNDTTKDKIGGVFGAKQQVLTP